MRFNTISKKLILLTFIVFAILFASSFLHFNEVLAKNYQTSSLWDGSDIGVTPLSDIEIDSQYVSFSMIMDDYLAIDANKTYVIETAYELYKLSLASRGLNQASYLSLDYVLGNDIDYFDALRENLTYLFVPIGYNIPFSGTFDGQGYEITNLIFQNANTDTEYDTYMNGLVYYAMFSQISLSGVVKNFGLINPLIVQALNIGAMVHMSTVAGLNQGLIQNVYYIDLREESAGINAEGEFIISGLVSVNQGTVSNSYIATPFVKSEAVYQNISSNVITFSNQGTFTHVYYDYEILLEVGISRTFGTPLMTAQFQNHTLFSADWYFKDSYQALTTDESLYQQLEMNQTYPILQGLDIINQTLLINDAVDFIYMNKLLLESGMFRSATYVINHDIDMNQVSRYAYQAASVGFSGILTSSLASESTSLYTHQASDGGNYLYHTIFNLKIFKSTSIGNYASYALFSSLFGQISHLNFSNFKIVTENIQEVSEKDFILIGGIAASASLAKIEDIHIDLEVSILSTNISLGKMYVGGLVAQGDVEISFSSTTGLINETTLTYQTRLDESIFSGMIGMSLGSSIDHSINDIDIAGINLNNASSGTTFFGGILGYGALYDLDYVVNTGNITTNTTGITNDIYLGGIVGLVTTIDEQMSFVINKGDLSTNVYQSKSIHASGFGTISDSLNSSDLISITNSGHINIYTPSTLSDQVLSSMNIIAAGTIILDGVNGFVKGLFNTGDQDIDISLVNTYAGVLIANNHELLTVEQVYQSGDISLYTSNHLAKENVNISGVIYGFDLDLNHIRQTGEINLIISQNSLNTLIDPKMYLTGVFNENSNLRTATNIYQGGEIKVRESNNSVFLHSLYVSGVLFANRNASFYQENNISNRSVDIKTEVGPLDTILNSGKISISGDFEKSIRVSGIVLYNYSMISNAINIGDIEIYDNIQTLNEQIQASGIVFAMIGEYAQIRDSANNGDILAVSETTYGYVHTAGIALRNDELENGTHITTGQNHQFAKIMFSINYGDVFAYNGTNESTYNITNETRSKASGILGIGMLSVIDTVNFGNIYSKYLASGIFGFVYFNRFGSIAADQVYISNSINYGKIRQITSYDSINKVLNYDLSQTPPSSLPYAFGAIVGKIHTGNTEWAFASDLDYPIDEVYFGYLLNFDEKIDMFAQAPDVTATERWFYNDYTDTEAANEAIMQMIKYMATTNPNDQSVPPFTQFEVLVRSGWWGFYHVEIFGQVITYLNYSEDEDGMFNENFAFRNGIKQYDGTDQYIFDFIEYIERDKVNDEILNHLENQTSNHYEGIYALSSSKGIDNGIFIPDNFSFEGLNPYTLDSIDANTTWIGDINVIDSIAYKMYVEMRQIKSSLSSTIYNLDLVQVDTYGDPIENGLVLSDPVIDQERLILTYYLPTNAQALNMQTSQNLLTSSFVEVSEGTAGASKIADIPGDGATLDDITYTWVGNYKKVNNQFYIIGPYHTSGNQNIYSNSGYNSNVTTKRLPFTTNYYERITGLDTIGGTSTIYTFNPYIAISTSWFGTVTYGTSGYRVSYQQTTSGYGPYATFNETDYRYDLLAYVGPSEELVTYVQQINQYKTVFSETNISFKANINEGYVISDGASLEVNGVSYTTDVTVPLSYGIYDSMYDQYGNYIDSVEDHYGNIRVYSSDYNPTNVSSYKDYEIRIIRTQAEDITDIASLFVNSNQSLPLNYQVNQVYPTDRLHYEYDGTNGILSITYETLNMAPNRNLLDLVDVYDANTSVKVYTSLYKLEDGNIENENIFDSSTGTWGAGLVTIDFILEDDFESGMYDFKLTLFSGETFIVTFEKIESSNAYVISFDYLDETVDVSSNEHTSYVPYGMYYQVSDTSTNIVNFTNIDSYANVYYSDVNQQLPSYLDGLMISEFSTISSIDLSINLIDGYRYQYDIIYHLVAEDGSMNTFTHHIIESPLSQTEKAIYKDGASLVLPLTQVDIRYEESPTLRITYDFEQTYFNSSNVLSVASDFSPLDFGMVSTVNEDYYLKMIADVGYEIDLNRTAPKGSYTYTLRYYQTYSLYGYDFEWDYTFNTITVVKHKNDNSLLSNVLFASDSVFDSVLDAFVTIIDINEVTPTEYLQYFDTLNPTERVISVLPTTGIDYDTYDDYPSYWIIGQVQETNLTGYLPTFYLPDGASIYRVIDQDHIDYTYQSSVLAADYTDFGDGLSLNYVQYRIYAEDYSENPTHYTDFYIAVQDATNNIKFDITVVNDTVDIIDRVFVRVNVYQYPEDYEEELTYNDMLISMGLYSYYNQSTNSYDNNQFTTSMYGFYEIYVDVEEGYSYSIEFEASPIIGDFMYLESSRIPRRYYVTIHIIEETPNTPNWGYHVTIGYMPPVLPLDIYAIYEPGDLFVYNNTTWKVITGNYVYDPYNPPGTGAWQGLQDASGIYSTVSSYEVGDVVYYIDRYYEAIASYASYSNPLAGIGNSWNELSEEWLSYNLYTTGDIVLYNGIYYISITSWNKGYQPNTTAWAWQVYE